MEGKTQLRAFVGKGKGMQNWDGHATGARKGTEARNWTIPSLGQIRKCTIFFHFTSQPPFFIRIDVIQETAQTARVSRRQNDVLCPILVTPK